MVYRVYKRIVADENDEKKEEYIITKGMNRKTAYLAFSASVAGTVCDYLNQKLLIPISDEY